MDHSKNQDLLFDLIKEKSVLKQDVFNNIILKTVPEDYMNIIKTSRPTKLSKFNLNIPGDISSASFFRL